MDLLPEHTLILEILRTSSLKTKFYWTGGTLLAHYYLHHRRSFDLDFFSETPFTRENLNPFVQSIRTRFPGIHITERKIFDRWEFLFEAEKKPVRIEFVYYNGEKKRLAPLSWYRGIRIDSLPDLAANKTMAYIDRNEVKDLFDIYALLSQKKFTVSQLLALLEKKFGVTLSEFTFWSESAKGFKNLDALKPYLLERDNGKRKELLTRVKFFFLDHGKEFLQKHLG